MGKVYKLDMNLTDVDVPDYFLNEQPTEEERKEFNKLNEEWNAADPKTRGGRPEFQSSKKPKSKFFVDTVMSAMHQVHPTGNVQQLKKTRSVSESLNVGVITNNGIAMLKEEEYKTIKSSMDKADKWNNNKESSEVIIQIHDAIAKAEQVDA